MVKVNKVKLTNLKNHKRKRCMLIIEMTRGLKFMRGRRDAQFEMHFFPAHIIWLRPVINSEVSFCAAIDTPSPKGPLSPDIGGVMLKGRPELHVEKRMGALVFLLKHSTVSTHFCTGNSSTFVVEIMCGDHVWRGCWWLI